MKRLLLFLLIIISYCALAQSPNIPVVHRNTILDCKINQVTFIHLIPQATAFENI